MHYFITCLEGSNEIITRIGEKVFLAQIVTSNEEKRQKFLCKGAFYSQFSESLSMKQEIQKEEFLIEGKVEIFRSM